MIVRIEAQLAEAVRGWTASVIERCQPRLCCEVGTVVGTAVELAMDVLRTWPADLFLVRATAGDLLLVDSSELPQLLREEFKRDGSVSVSRIDRVGGCLFDFSISESDNTEEGELLAAGWGDAEESVREVQKRDSSATVFRGN